LQMQKLGEHKPGWTRSDDSDLSAYSRSHCPNSFYAVRRRRSDGVLKNNLSPYRIRSHFAII